MNESNLLTVHNSSGSRKISQSEHEPVPLVSSQVGRIFIRCGGARTKIFKGTCLRDIIRILPTQSCSNMSTIRFNCCANGNFTNLPLVISIDFPKTEYKCIHYSGSVLKLDSQGAFRNFYQQMIQKMPAEDKAIFDRLLDISHMKIRHIWTAPSGSATIWASHYTYYSARINRSWRTPADYRA